MKPTEYLCKFIVELSFQDFSREVLEMSKVCLLDWLGVTLGGLKEPASVKLFDLVEPLGGEAQATILGHGLKTTSLNAAFVNGVMAHVLDYDDAHSETRNHTSAPLVAAVLAVAEHHHLSGPDFLEAYLTGFEVSSRIGLALGKQYYERGWHATSILGRFGAAVGTSKALRLNARQVENALGLAATQSGGIRSAFGTMAKPFHAGKAAMDGMLSALLSQSGFTGPKAVLDDDSEYVTLFSSEFDPNFLTRPVTQDFHIMTTSMKLYAACLLLHPVIDGLLAIRDECGTEPKDIQRIELEVAPLCLSVTDNPKVQTDMEGKFSIQFCSALALAKGKVGSRNFLSDSLNDSQIRDLMQKVNAKTNPKLRETEAKMSVYTSEGLEHRRHVSSPKGDPGNPVAFDEIVEKFGDLNEDKLSKKNIQEIVACVRELEAVPDVGHLVRLCCPGLL
jgi:2-methylcitrate dehydratase PrpD